MGGVFGSHTGQNQAQKSSSSWNSAETGNQWESGAGTSQESSVGAWPWSTGQQALMGGAETWLGKLMNQASQYQQGGYQPELTKQAFESMSADVTGQAQKQADQIRGEFAKMGGLRSSGYGNETQNFWSDVTRGLTSQRSQMALADLESQRNWELGIMSNLNQYLGTTRPPETRDTSSDYTYSGTGGWTSKTSGSGKNVSSGEMKTDTRPGFFGK